METFVEAKELTVNPSYQEQRQKCLEGLADVMIEAPITGPVTAFNKLSYCFTMQSCYGHFLYNDHWDTYNLDPLPDTNTIASVEYRIAYIAFCVEDSDSGRRLMEALKELTVIDPENVQFCCAEWFWERHINSYALQVEPDRFKNEDRAILDYAEALKIERIRNEFFIQLKYLLQRQ